MPASRKPSDKRAKDRGTTAASLAAALVPRIRPLPAKLAKPRLADLAEAAAEAGVARELAVLLKAHEPLAAFLAAVTECAPFLRGLVLDDPARLVRLLGAEAGASRRRILAATAQAWKGGEAKLMQALRRLRQELALLTALADLGGVWDLAAVTGALTAFADAAVGAAVRLILDEARTAGQIELPDAAHPETGSGWIILGMGKYGAGELNYSSDIDLIVLYEARVVRLPGDAEPVPFFVRLTKRLVRILQERDAEGYVFRVDLRLRPDPGATNIAMSTDAALQYYESLGQNWERAALIKARPVAGDVPAGEAFLGELVPYVWRKYLDYAAIADIHSIKRQIHDHRGHAEVAVAGHNIKLGRGGIREIEFFVQTQQLIAGGRNPGLRSRGTLQTLGELAREGWIDGRTAGTLGEAYARLREIEHCLQMVADEQTHTLPDDPERLAVIARMAGYASTAAFARALTATLRRVSEAYSRLFETAPSLGTETGSLVFTGDDEDPGTLETLSRLGYSQPADVIRTVRGWHFGRYPAMRSATARERLTEIAPALLAALAHTDNADAAFVAFDRFLARLPAGVQLFSMLGSNRGLLDLLALIMGTAPRLAETIVRRAHVLDAVIEPAFFGGVPDRDMLAARLAAFLAQTRSYEEVLDRARIFGQEQWFLIGVRVLAGAIDARRAGHAYADLAEVLAVALLDAARAEFERAHGVVRGGRVALVALGKLGGREMTAASDLDLMLVYDHADGAAESSGERPLAPGLYFARLTQRIVAALSTPTAEGPLYAVDFRLRPSGNSGPIATHIDAFAVYQAREAWTWEHMALTRARVIAGDEALVKRVRRQIDAVLREKRDRAKLTQDVLEMRAMIHEAKGGEGAWDLKVAPGGLVDIEFVAQYLQLLHGHDSPAILSTETEAALAAAAGAGILPPKEADIVLPALRLWQALTQILRLCVEGPFEPEEAPRGFLKRLAEAGELPDFATLDAHVRATEKAVRESFERLVGPVPPGSV
jgi:glutamate-ammonia-ligase adenylyltransferase